MPSSQASFYPYVLAVTEYISATQLKVLLPAVDLVYPSGTPGIQINVTNPTPGGGTSPAVYVIVVGQSSPQITSISPTSVPAGSFGFILTVNGSGFIPYATNVLFNGNGGQTTGVNGNQVTFAVTGAMVQPAGTIPVQVQVGPTTFTNTVSFTITPATTPATIQAPLVSATSTNQTSPTKQQLTAQFLTGRFLGWKAAQFLGQAYTAKYQRELARLAPAVANTGAGTSDTHNLAASATIPPAPAAFNLRPTLPAGFIPTAVITGDLTEMESWIGRSPIAATTASGFIWEMATGQPNCPQLSNYRGMRPSHLLRRT